MKEEKREKKSILTMLVLVVLLSIITISVYYLTGKYINDFEKCVKAGNPILDSYPRQCKVKDGRTFTEVIVVVNESSYQCPETKTIDCMPTVDTISKPYCAGPYHEWIVKNCNIEFAY